MVVDQKFVHSRKRSSWDTGVCFSWRDFHMKRVCGSTDEPTMRNFSITHAELLQRSMMSVFGYGYGASYAVRGIKSSLLLTSYKQQTFTPTHVPASKQRNV